MKLIGFWPKHDGDKIIREYLCELHNPPEVLPTEMEVGKIIEYLDNGESILTIMDGDLSIGVYKMLSDGEWIWPSHFSYYIKKGDYSYLTKEFVSHVLSVDRIPERKMTYEQRVNVERYIIDRLKIRQNMRK